MFIFSLHFKSLFNSFNSFPYAVKKNSGSYFPVFFENCQTTFHAAT